ncbi:mRNA-decapping enzyme subunit 2 [Nematocida homosporus]|uniref:mRNA-decapping enzyme subunit 2 n=1 Tax=Nematocida homosporus TaxID=1912981 RepID=UPI00221F03F7|nr:mRNA-decapping enzyme subunit 2 [Nematocida homosporus]KAI5184348.1 mRNA-decapping enzyme subunit 2 [Nematocida homosporus]
MKLEDVLDDLAGRFLMHLPACEEKNAERFLFQVEEAHWFYEDYYRRKYNFPYLNLKEFFILLMGHSQYLKTPGELEDEFKKFLKYKKAVPVFGALIFNGPMTKILMVRGFGPRKTFTFPRGKICKSENEIDCAIREVYEEVGFDISDKIIRGLSLNMHTKLRDSKLFVILNVPESTKFVTQTRNEIKEIKWINLSLIESSNAETLTYIKSYIKEIKNVVKMIEQTRIKLDRKKIRKAFGL